MAVNDTIFPAIAGVISTVILTFGGIWVKRRADRDKGKRKKEKEDILSHPVFDRMSQLKAVEVRDMTTGDSRKDGVMKQYARLVLDVYRDELQKYAQEVSSRHPQPAATVSEFYLKLVDRLDKEFEASGIPRVYLDPIIADSAVDRSSLSNEILDIQKDAEVDYLEKVFKTFEMIRVHLGILICRVEHTTEVMDPQIFEGLGKAKK